MLKGLRILSILLLFFLMNCNISICYKSHRFNTRLRESSNVPIRRDLYKYLDIIKSVTNFFHNNLNVVDLSVYFGAFLANVNLKHAIKRERWFFTRASRSLLDEIANMNGELIRNFQAKVKQESADLKEEDERIFKLFSNETVWTNNIEKFRLVKLEGHTSEEIEHILYNWDQYVDKINAVEKDLPNPKKSDECLISLAENPIYNTKYSKCSIDKYCIEAIRNGTNCGYALTHRLLYMLSARLGRSCVVFSPQEDRYLTKRFCSMLYAEAMYIASNNFKLLDLMLEMMCLCSLNGYSQFINGPWLEAISQFQASSGCFVEFDLNKTMLRTSRKRKGIPSKKQINLSRCNSHTTTLALATYAQAIRFILESY